MTVELREGYGFLRKGFRYRVEQVEAAACGIRNAVAFFKIDAKAGPQVVPADVMPKHKYLDMLNSGILIVIPEGELGPTPAFSTMLITASGLAVRAVSGGTVVSERKVYG